MAVRAERVTEQSIHWLNDDEARAIVDEQARKVMGMSGEEFLRRYDAGEFNDIPDDWEHMDFTALVMLIGYGR